MTLTTEQVIEILIDATTGREPSVTGPEADELRQAIAKDIEKAKEQGYSIRVPSEWEVEGATGDTVAKGGPGSGCNPSVGTCGRPSTGNKEFTYKTRFPHAFKYDAKDPVSTKYTRNGEIIDKFIVTPKGEFLPVTMDDYHGSVWESGTVLSGAYDASEKVIQDLPRKVALIRLSYPDKQILDSAIRGNDLAMSTVLDRQRALAEKLYGNHKGMTIVLASGGSPIGNDNNLPRTIDDGHMIPDNVESFVDKRFIYKT